MRCLRAIEALHLADPFVAGGPAGGSALSARDQEKDKAPAAALPPHSEGPLHLHLVPPATTSEMIWREEGNGSPQSTWLQVPLGLCVSRNALAQDQPEH